MLSGLCGEVRWEEDYNCSRILLVALKTSCAQRQDTGRRVLRRLRHWRNGGCGKIVRHVANVSSDNVFLWLSRAYAEYTDFNGQRLFDVKETGPCETGPSSGFVCRKLSRRWFDVDLRGVHALKAFSDEVLRTVVVGCGPNAPFVRTELRLLPGKREQVNLDL